MFKDLSLRHYTPNLREGKGRDIFELIVTGKGILSSTPINNSTSFITKSY